MIAHLLADPTFWVMISTVLCFGFIGFKAYKPILTGLDSRAEAIRHRLAEADALHREAEMILEEYKQKSANAMVEAQEIMKNAEARVEQLRVQMEAELKDSIARQEANAKMRIARMQNEAIDAVKSAIVQTSVEHAQGTIKDSAANQNALNSLDAISKSLQ
jgi:F-type H+-transporting ATPase subunit b